VSTFATLAAKLVSRFGSGVAQPWPDAQFDELALEVFAWQFASNDVYRRFAEGRGATPDTVARWQDIPPVPVRAFKRLKLVSGDPRSVERVFRTSGTTEGSLRGEHHLPRLELYRAALLPPFRARLLPDDASLRFLSLVPSPGTQPDSSLSTMIGTAMDVFGAARSEWLATPHGLDVPGLTSALRNAERDGQPVLLLGTAFAFVHWLEALGARGADTVFRLPPGSRLLETGGFKGRSRVVPRHELYAALSRRLGLGPEWMVNEYGMTELLSQYYEPGMGEPTRAGPLEELLDARRLVAPPWLRYRVLDPTTLESVPDGRRGLLAHYDLANAGSVMAVLTEDLGYRDGGGLRLLGRPPGAEPRGCSVAMDELLSAAERP
jgi:hypothetical protein